MATFAKRGDKYLVRWEELHVTRQADGTEVREWKGRGRSVPTARDAKRLVAEIESLQGAGQRWEDQREVGMVTLRTIGDAYAAAAEGRPAATVRWRRSVVAAWLDFAGHDTPARSRTMRPETRGTSLEPARRPSPHR